MRNKKGNIIKEFVHNNDVASLALSSDNKILITGDNNSLHIKLWNIKTGK